MTPDQVFSLANMLALAGWILLIALPRRRWVTDIAAAWAIPGLLAAGWVHYLAFDLLVGSWQVHDARERGIPHLIVAPCLVLTFLVGPAGWLLYRLVRAKFRPASA